MERRFYLYMALVALIIGILTIPAVAQTRTFYIDYASGSNSNSGTMASPWKTHPYMQTGAACTVSGRAPAYSHVAGDRFIFKGGVTWPAGCFNMNIPAGGADASHRDYYGVEGGFGTGRAIFDLQNQVALGSWPHSFVQFSAKNIDFDNIEMKRQQFGTSTGSGCDQASIKADGVSNISVRNLLIHGWMMPALTSGSISHETASICGDGIDVVDNVEMYDSDGGAVANGNLAFGSCYRNLNGEVKNSKCHDVAQGVVGHGPIHDSQFYNIDGVSVQNLVGVSSWHSNIIEATYITTAPIYNNLIHDTNAGVTIFECARADIYNNVMWNNSNSHIKLESNPNDAFCGSDQTATANIYNNTLVSNGNFCVDVIARSGGSVGTLNLKNNQCITSTTAFCYNGGACGTVKTVNASSNITQSPSQAAAQGYTASNKYQAASGTAATVNVGLNLSNLCSADMQLLCSDILQAPRGTSWDVGAYKFGAASSSNPVPPTNLSVTVN